MTTFREIKACWQSHKTHNMPSRDTEANQTECVTSCSVLDLIYMWNLSSELGRQITIGVETSTEECLCGTFIRLHIGKICDLFRSMMGYALYRATSMLSKGKGNGDGRKTLRRIWGKLSWRLTAAGKWTTINLSRGFWYQRCYAFGFGNQTFTARRSFQPIAINSTNVPTIFRDRLREIFISVVSYICLSFTRIRRSNITSSLKMFSLKDQEVLQCCDVLSYFPCRWYSDMLIKICFKTQMSCTSLFNTIFNIPVSPCHPLVIRGRPLLYIQ